MTSQGLFSPIIKKSLFFKVVLQISAHRLKQNLTGLMHLLHLQGKLAKNRYRISKIIKSNIFNLLVNKYDSNSQNTLSSFRDVWYWKSQILNGFCKSNHLTNFFRAMPIIFYESSQWWKPINNSLKTFLFNRLDKILESKSEINS